MAVAAARALTCDLFDGVGPHVEQHGAVRDAGTQLKQTVQRQRGHVRFTPPLTTVFYVLLKLQPPENTTNSHLDHLPVTAG